MLRYHDNNSDLSMDMQLSGYPARRWKKKLFWTNTALGAWLEKLEQFIFCWKGNAIQLYTFLLIVLQWNNSVCVCAVFEGFVVRSYRINSNNLL